MSAHEHLPSETQGSGLHNQLKKQIKKKILHFTYKLYMEYNFLALGLVFAGPRFLWPAVRAADQPIRSHPCGCNL